MKAASLLWNTLTTLAFNTPINKSQKQKMMSNIDDGIGESYREYDSLPQSEKDRMCVEMAQSMGCQSSDVKVCSKYIYNYAWSK